MTLHVLITVDTESYASGHPDQQIWGRTTDGGEYGIRRIMDILEKHGALGTFYVNVYEAERNGEETIREVIRTIHDRGHDVELHTHPRDRYGIDKLTRADVPRQREILAWGKDFIEKVTGSEVIAHRAGAFAANLNTIAALGELGIKVDASLSPVWFESHLAREVESPNRPFMLKGILELPVTYYVQGTVGKRHFDRMVDIEASSLRELKSVVRQAIADNAGSINLLMHSHSFVRGGRPDFNLLRRFDRALEYLSRQPNVAFSTTRQFYEQWVASEQPDEAMQPFLPYTGWWLTYLRAVESIGKGWKNTLTALAPPALLAVAGALAVIALTR